MLPLSGTLSPLSRRSPRDGLLGVPNLALYLSAYDFAASADGTALATWTGREAAHSAWTQGTAGKRPTKQTQGGYPVARFAAASSQFLTITSYTALQLTSKTVVLVARNSSALSALRALLGAATANWYVGGIANAGQQLITSHANTVPAQVTVATTPGVWDTALHVYTARWIVSGVNVTVTIYRDGSGVATGTATFTSGYNAVGATAWFLGAFSAAANFWDGDIGACVVTSDTTDAVRQQIERTLGPQWGCTVA